MRHKMKYVLLFVILLLAVVFPLALQYRTGSLEGTVADPRGPIAGASVEARNLMTGAVLRVNTDATGHYELKGLRVGRYSLWTEAGGHEPLWILQVFVEPGQATHRDILLVARSLVT